MDTVDAVVAAYSLAADPDPCLDSESVAEPVAEPAAESSHPPRTRPLSTITTASSRYSRSSFPAPRIPLPIHAPSSDASDASDLASRRASMPAASYHHHHYRQSSLASRRRTFTGVPPELALGHTGANGLRPLRLQPRVQAQEDMDDNDDDRSSIYSSQSEQTRRRLTEQAVRREWLRRREQQQQRNLVSGQPREEAEGVQQMRGELLASVARAENNLLNMKDDWTVGNDKDSVVQSSRGGGLHPLGPMTDSRISTSAVTLESLKKETQLALEAGRLVGPSTGQPQKAKSRAHPPPPPPPPQSPPSPYNGHGRRDSRESRDSWDSRSLNQANKPLPPIPAPSSAGPMLPPRAVPPPFSHPAMLPTPPQSPHRRRYSKEAHDRNSYTASNANQDYWRKSLNSIMTWTGQ